MTRMLWSTNHTGDRFGTRQRKSRRMRRSTSIVTMTVGLIAGCVSLPSGTPIVSEAPIPRTSEPSEVPSGRPARSLLPQTTSTALPSSVPSARPSPRPFPTPTSATVPGHRMDDPIMVEGLPFSQAISATDPGDWLYRSEETSAGSSVRHAETGQDLTWFRFAPTESVTIGAWTSGTQVAASIYALDREATSGPAVIECGQLARSLPCAFKRSPVTRRDSLELKTFRTVRFRGCRGARSTGSRPDYRPRRDSRWFQR